MVRTGHLFKPPSMRLSAKLSLLWGSGAHLGDLCRHFGSFHRPSMQGKQWKTKGFPIPMRGNEISILGPYPSRGD